MVPKPAIMIARSLSERFCPVLFARLLLALLEGCNPDFSSNRATYGVEMLVLDRAGQHAVPTRAALSAAISLAS